MSFPGLTTGTRSEAVPLLAGPRHEEILSALHAHLKPRTYLEIGVEHGETAIGSMSVDRDRSEHAD